jgi:hypothetical protein
VTEKNPPVTWAFLSFFLCDELPANEYRYIRPGTTLGTPPTSVGRRQNQVHQSRLCVTRAFTCSSCLFVCDRLATYGEWKSGLVPPWVHRLPVLGASKRVN